MRKNLTIIALLIPLFFAVPLQAQAVDWFPLVPCGLNAQPATATRMDTLPDGTQVPHDYTQPCNRCLLVELGKNVIDMTFFGIVPSVGTLLFMIAGFIILFNARNGNAGGVTKGKEIMTNTAIGIAIILSAWLIANFILKSIATEEVAGTPWYQVQCTTGNLEDLVDGTISSGGTGTGGGSGGTGGGGSGTGGGSGGGTGGGSPVQCSQSSLNLCQGNSSAGCANSNCAQYLGMIKNQVYGAATENVLKAFMEVESSCNPSAATATSFGIMQLSPGTATVYASQCGVQSSAVNRAWLLDPANIEKSICISARYIDAISKGQCGLSIRNIYAGYNGGEQGSAGACAPSVNCSGQSCSGEPIKRWECLYDDNAKKVCNTGYNQTRQGATRVQYCAINPGF